MKNSFGWAIVLSLLLAGFLYYSIHNMKGISYSTSSISDGSSIEFPESDTAFGGLLYTPFINDSIPHYRYKRINDSIQDVKKSLTLESNRSFTGYEVGFVGAFKYKPNKRNKLFKAFVDSLDKLSILQSTSKDSVNRSAIQKRIDSLKSAFYVTENDEETTTSYCISLSNYNLKEDAKFFVQNNSYYLAYVNWDSAKVGSNMYVMHGHYARKQIAIMYSEAQNKIYIPVTKREYTFTNIIVNIWGIFLLICSILTMLILPIFILVAISRGNAFTHRNIFGLKIITYSFVFFTISKISEPFILHFIFKSKIPTELQRMNFREILNDSFPFVILSIILFLILKAFQKGYKLQQEQDLTV
jgi:Protein of unknown function (DUF2975)